MVPNFLWLWHAILFVIDRGFSLLLFAAGYCGEKSQVTTLGKFPVIGLDRDGEHVLYSITGHCLCLTTAAREGVVVSVIRGSTVKLILNS